MTIYINPTYIAVVKKLADDSASIVLSVHDRRYTTKETYETFVSRLELQVRQGEFIAVEVNA